MKSTTNLFNALHLTVTPAMATPLDRSGYKVNVEIIPQLVDFLIERGVGGIFAGGTTGEGILLSLDERVRLHNAMLEAVNGRTPTLLHIGTNNLVDTVKLGRASLSSSLSSSPSPNALVVMPPTFYKMTNDALFGYFAEIASALPDIPFLVYDIPHLAINGISPDLLTRLCTEIPSFAGIKCSRPDGQALTALLTDLPPDKLFLAGNENLVLGSMAMGATGAISGLSTAIPEPFVAMYSAIKTGHLINATQHHRNIKRILTILNTRPRVGYIKAILRARGIDVGHPMPPRDTVDESIWDEVSHLLNN